jgi:aarF domain-containing kinase
MEFVQGGQVNDVDYINKNNIDPWLLSTRLGDMYSEMIFR